MTRAAAKQKRPRRGPKVPRIGEDGLSFGARLKKLREERDLSFSDVASQSGMSAQAIAKYEANPASEPEFFNGLALAAALRVSPWELAGLPEPSYDQLTLPRALGAPPVAIRVQSTRPNASQATIDDRLRELEASAKYRDRVLAEKVNAIGVALSLLVDSQEPLETLRARMKELLGPSQEDQS